MKLNFLNTTHKRKKVIILLGPTGVGKTGLSIILAKALDTEIISADSMQVYCYMDIGTAKPPPVLLREVKHHLINILEPYEYFSAGMFKRMASEIIDDLHKRDKVPIIVGGTGLYIRTLTQGLFEGPSADWQLREALLREERNHGKGYLYEYLKKIDPEASKKINPNDTRRITRAIEVSLKGERRISELQCLLTTPQDYNFIKIGLLRDRKELYRLIDHRIDKMIAEGLIDEVKSVLKIIEDRGQTNVASLPSMQALGYKEMRLYLAGLLSLEDAVRLIKKRTRMYAKRQFTWFKKEAGISWVDITGMMDDKEIFSKVINEVQI